MKFTTTQISVATAAFAGSRKTGAPAPGSFYLDGQTLQANLPAGPDRYRNAMTPQFESKRAELQGSQPRALGLSAYESFIAWTAWVTDVERANRWLAERGEEAERQWRWAQAAEATLPVDTAEPAPSGGAAPQAAEVLADWAGGAHDRRVAGITVAVDPPGGQGGLSFSHVPEPREPMGQPAPAPMQAWLASWRASAQAAAATRIAKAASERRAPRGSRQHPPDSALRHHSPAPERSRSVALAIEHHGADG